ncbi:chorismate mutase [Nocardia sp. NPDC051030]|uniref:chorismate mutase n=1 Tax=Nocardia sp. NPDC051030 TaxID=3155162 RepID=UPI0034478536
MEAITSMKRLAVSAGVAMVLAAGQLGVAAAEDNSGSLDGLVGLLGERLATADTVAAVKWEGAVRDGGEPVIDDPGREEAIYEAMGQLGAQRDLPAGLVRQVFQGQIDASKIVQRGLVAEWRYGLAAAPAPATDLAGIRPVIDGLNIAIVDELASERTELARPDCLAQVAAGVLTVAGRNHLDPLHTAALVRASTPLCGS